MTQNMRPGGLFAKNSFKYLTISKPPFLKYQDNIFMKHLEKSGGFFLLIYKTVTIYMFQFFSIFNHSLSIFFFVDVHRKLFLFLIIFLLEPGAQKIHSRKYLNICLLLFWKDVATKYFSRVSFTQHCFNE